MGYLVKWILSITHYGNLRAFLLGEIGASQPINIHSRCSPLEEEIVFGGPTILVMPVMGFLCKLGPTWRWRNAIIHIGGNIIIIFLRLSSYNFPKLQYLIVGRAFHLDKVTFQAKSSSNNSHVCFLSCRGHFINERIIYVAYTTYIRRCMAVLATRHPLSYCVLHDL